MDEGPPEDGETPLQYVTRLATEKANQVAKMNGDALVIGADTAVVFDGSVLGKPASDDEAVQMLRMLRGRSNTIITGVAVGEYESGRWLTTSKSTDVVMRNYTDAEIETYVASGDPMDKAGAYAAQHEVFRPVSIVNGCWLNAIGFPLCEVVDVLAELGFEARIRHGWQVPDKCVNCPLRNRGLET